MYEICRILKEIREQHGIALQSVHDSTGIHIAQLSRIENGKRLPTLEQIHILAKTYGCDEKQLIIQRESDLLTNTISYPEIASDTLKVAEAKVLHGSQYLSLFPGMCCVKPTIDIESRR